MKKLFLFVVLFLITAHSFAQETVITDMNEIPLKAGPGATAAYLAPNGEIFAYITREQLCIYTIEGEEQACSAYPEALPIIDDESIQWSPDSTKIAFNGEFFRTLNEPDLWIFDVETGEFANLTEDNMLKLSLNETQEWDSIDLIPRWSPDSEQILFVRYSREGEDMITTLYTINADGSDLTEVTDSLVSGPYPITVMDWQPENDLLVFNLFRTDEREDNGLWVSKADGSDARQVFFAEEQENTPMMVSVSADGKFALITDASMGRFGPRYDQPETSPVRLIDLESGEAMPVDPEHSVMSAGWSPDGTSIIYTTYSQTAPEETGVYLTSEIGETGQQLLEGRFLAATSQLRRAIVWTENNTVLLSKQPEEGIVILTLGEE